MEETLDNLYMFVIFVHNQISIREYFHSFESAKARIDRWPWTHINPDECSYSLYRQVKI